MSAIKTICCWMDYAARGATATVFRRTMPCESVGSCLTDTVTPHCRLWKTAEHRQSQSPQWYRRGATALRLYCACPCSCRRFLKGFVTVAPLAAWNISPWTETMPPMFLCHLAVIDSIDRPVTGLFSHYSFLMCIFQEVI